jgi:hypothetical protein
MFKMKPNKGTLVASGVVLLLGILFFLDSIRDPGDIAAHGRGKLMLAVSVVVSGLLFIISTGRMWFKHLWHDRYR